jgi:hypothetical protein
VLYAVNSIIIHEVKDDLHGVEGVFIYVLDKAVIYAVSRIVPRVVKRSTLPTEHHRTARSGQRSKYSMSRIGYMILSTSCIFGCPNKFKDIESDSADTAIY